MKLSQKQRRALIEAQEYANFERANFDGIADDLSLEHSGNSTFILHKTQTYTGGKWIDVTKRYTITEFIIERTRLYRDSWLNPIFEELLSEGPTE